MLADQFDAFLFDLDGVIYLGDQPLPGAVEAVRRLHRMGKIVRFLTNDPRPTRQAVARRLTQMGIAADPAEVVTAGWAAAQYLDQNAMHSAYIVGSFGLASEVIAAGIEVVDEAPCDAVVVGCDTHVSYLHIQKAAQCIHEGAQFVATNADGSFPMPEGPYPATGAIVEAVRAATGKRPVIVGKPAAQMFRAVLQDLDPRTRAVMIGDNAAADIVGAHQAGIAGILVSSTDMTFPSARDFRTPDATISGLLDLFDVGRQARAWQPYDFPWPDRVAAGVAAVVFDTAQRVLLVRRSDNGLWGLPSGHIEPGETVVEAVQREVFEEAGLEVTVQRLIGIYSEPASQVFAYPSGDTVHFVTCCCQCVMNGGQARADGVEILDVGFFAEHALPTELLPMHPQWLADALASSELAFLR